MFLFVREKLLPPFNPGKSKVCTLQEDSLSAARLRFNVILFIIMLVMATVGLHVLKGMRTPTVQVIIDRDHSLDL